MGSRKETTVTVPAFFPQLPMASLYKHNLLTSCFHPLVLQTAGFSKFNLPPALICFIFRTGTDFSNTCSPRTQMRRKFGRVLVQLSNCWRNEKMLHRESDCSFGLFWDQTNLWRDQKQTKRKKKLGQNVLRSGSEVRGCPGNTGYLSVAGS